MIDGIKTKLERDFNFNIKSKRDPIDSSSADQLIFQRVLGHKEEQPGTGQWFETSEEAVGCRPHYKNECWICDRHVFSVIFWSRAMAFKMTPIFNKEQTEIVRYAIDCDLNEEEGKELIYTNANVKYSQLDNQVPYLCGSFTGWRYHKMYSLEEFNRKFDDSKMTAFDLAAASGKIRKRTENESQCNDYERSWLKYFEAQEKLRFIYDWKQFFKKSLRFKKPFVLNGHFYYD